MNNNSFASGPFQTAGLIIVTAAFLFLFASCGNKEVKSETYDSEKYMALARKQMDEKNYEEARKTLFEVQNRDSSRKYAPLARLRTAEAYILDGEKDRGIEEYRKFIELYPDNENAPYAQYRIAMTYFEQIESPDRGAGTAAKALLEFELLKRLFPRNPYNEAVDLRIKKCLDVIADGEYMVAEFYFKKDSYNAAKLRLEGLILKFPLYKDMDKALLLLGKSYKNLKMKDKAEETLTKLIEKFPSSKSASEAKKEL